MTRDTWQNLGLAAFTAAVLASVVWLLAFWPPTPPTVDLAPVKPLSAPARPPAALVVGDSYSAGVMLADPSDAFPDLVANRCGWQLVLDGQPGTGYLTKGTVTEGAQTYAQRVPDYADIDVAVLTGGYNDYWAIQGGQTMAAFHASVDDTLTATQKALPGARLVVVGVFWPKHGPVPADVRTMDTVLQRAAQRNGATFVPAGWFHDADLGRIIASDDIHPNGRGQRLIADHLARRLCSG